MKTRAQAIRHSKRIETVQTVFGVLQYLAAAAVMVSQALACCPDADWLIIAALMVVGGSFSMHLANHERERDFTKFGQGGE